MAWTWPAVGRVARVPARLLGEVALAAALLATLGFTSTDGTPINDSVGSLVPTVAFVRAPLMDFHWFGTLIADGIHVTLPPAPARVPTSPPAMILIASLNVHRPVEPVGLDRSGMMYQPENLWNAGWYKGGPVPGAPGDAVLEGHAGYPDAPLLFGKLRQLKSSDKIVIVLGDGTQQLFLVDSVAIWPAGKSPAGMGEPYGPPRLTLITCTGPFDDHYKTYADRLIVEASYAGLA